MSYFVTFRSVVPMRAEASETAEMISQLLFGEYGTILDAKGSFVRVENYFDKYQGWVDAKMIENLSDRVFFELTLGKTFRVNQALVEAENIADISDVLRLTGGSLLPAYNPQNSTFGVGEENRYYIHPDAVVDATNPKDIISLEFARQYTETPYLWGGKNAMGIDCSGFSQVVYAVSGIGLPRDASQQIKQGVKVPSLNEVLPGDLAFFDKNGKITHVGILLSKQKIIHSSGWVKVEFIDKEGIINSRTGKYSHHLYEIRRYTDNNSTSK